MEVFRLTIKINENVSGVHTIPLKETAKTANNNGIEINFTSAPVERGSKNDPKLSTQVDTVINKAKVKLKKIPAPFNLLGSEKIQKDAYKIMDDPKFRSDVVGILETSASKPENTNKDAIGLARDKATYNQLLAYIRKRANDSSVLSFILNNKAADSKLYEFINSDEALEFLKES